MYFLHTQSPDSTEYLLDSISELSQAAGFNIELWLSIGMPIILLIVCSILKHTVGVGLKEIKGFELFTEMAIDLLPIFGAFIVGRFFLESTGTRVLLSSILIVGVIAAVTMIVTIFRRFADYWKRGSATNVYKAFGFLVAEYLLDIGCVILIFKI